MSALLSYVVHWEVNKHLTHMFLNTDFNGWSAIYVIRRVSSCFQCVWAISNKHQSRYLLYLPPRDKYLELLYHLERQPQERVMTPWQHISRWMMTVNSYQPSIRKVWYDIKFFGFWHSAVHKKKWWNLPCNNIRVGLHTPCHRRNQLSQRQLTRLYGNCCQFRDMLIIQHSG